MSKTKIPKGWVKISEFEQFTGISFETVKMAIRQGKIPPEYVHKTTTNPTAPTYIDPQAAAVHWYTNLNATHPNSKHTRTALEKYIKTFDREVVTEHQQKGLTGEMTFADAQLKEARARAELKELELAEKRGTVVQKEAVYSQLFAFHRELRDALLSIPDRISDELMAVADSRNRVHTTIYDAIEEVLQKLSETKERTLGE
jgi:phage terminase Nu1 subunit (DNA packaging protein)